MINKPKFNWQSIGHDKILEYLEYFIIKSKINHAYLMYGNPNIGKNSIACQFIKFIYCFENAKKQSLENSTFPCNNCIHCTQLNKNLHPDFLIIKKEYNNKLKKFNKNITIEQIRNLSVQLYTAKFLNSYKIALIQDADTLSESAFNSLLKMLEEPPQKVIIIMVANTLKTIPKTIISRCQQIHMHPVPRKVLKNYLLSKNFNNLKADNLANLVNGQPELMLKLINNEDELNDYVTTATNFISLLKQKKYQKFNIVNELSKTHKDTVLQQEYLNKILNIWLILLRDIILYKHSINDFVNFKIIENELKGISHNFKISEIHNITQQIKKIQKLIHLNINQKLALENLILNI